MAGVGIVKAEYDDTEFQAIMAALAKAASPKLAELADFAGSALDTISRKTAFMKECDPVTGEKWKPLKHPRNDKKKSTRPILQFGGQLRRSLLWEAYPDGSVVFGSNMEYARIHQKGGEAGRGKKTKIPARPYMGVPADFDRRILSDPAMLELLGLGG